MNSLGVNIKKLRTRRGLTQQSLADLVGATTYTTISKWESGANSPRGGDLVLLSELFNVSVDGLLGLNEDLEEKHNYTYMPTSISAGLPIDVDGITNADTIAIPDVLMGKHAGDTNIIITKIYGDSMDKIMPDGSLIAIKPTALDNLKDGDIVVFSNDHDYSVKHYHKHGDTLVFKPNSTNDAHYDQTYNVGNNITIHGKVVMWTVTKD